jgi:hypothetical protein
MRNAATHFPRRASPPPPACRAQGASRDGTRKWHPGRQSAPAAGEVEWKACKPPFADGGIIRKRRRLLQVGDIMAQRRFGFRTSA